MRYEVRPKKVNSNTGGFLYGKERTFTTDLFHESGGKGYYGPMRDGVRLAVDVYRPDAKGRFPALLAFAYHNKFLQVRN